MNKKITQESFRKRMILTIFIAVMIMSLAIVPLHVLPVEEPSSETLSRVPILAEALPDEIVSGICSEEVPPAIAPLPVLPAGTPPNEPVSGLSVKSTEASPDEILSGFYSEEVWIARYNGPGNGEDSARAIAVDGSGNVYIAGITWGGNVGDGGTNFDYTTIKYDSIGNSKWIRHYNGPYDDRANAMAVDDSGNVFVTGRSVGGIETSTDYVTIKYDSTGNEEWVRRYNGPINGPDEANAIAVDGIGNIYVTGNSKGSGTDFDYVTIKYDPTGKEEWVRWYNGPGNGADSAHAIAVDRAGNVFITGRSDGSGSLRDYATIKYDPGGKEEWVTRYNGPGNSDDSALAITVDDSGNVYVTGYDGGTETLSDYATIKYAQYILYPEEIYSGTYSEDFTTTTYRGLTSTVVGWGSGTISCPPKSYNLLGFFKRIFNLSLFDSISEKGISFY